MAKNKKYKRSFKAYRVNKNTFQIKDQQGALKPGQQVLISRETDEPILHFATGKEIGKVELKIGVGNVITDNRSNGAVIVHSRDGEIAPPSFIVKINAPIKTAAVVDKERLLRISSVKGYASPKTFRMKNSPNYIAKIIE